MCDAAVAWTRGGGILPFYVREWVDEKCPGMDTVRCHAGASDSACYEPRSFSRLRGFFWPSSAMITFEGRTAVSEL